MRRRNPTRCGLCDVWVTCLTQHNKRLKHIAAMARIAAVNPPALACTCAATHATNIFATGEVSAPIIAEAHA